MDFLYLLLFDILHAKFWKMNRSPFVLVVLAACFILSMSSCRAPKDLEFREFKNLSVQNLGFTNANLKVDLVYYNPNNFGLELAGTDLDIFIDSTLLGHSLQDVQVAIPRKDVFTIPLKVDLDMRNLLKNGITAYFNKDVKVKVLGRVKVGKAGVYKSFNVDYTTIQNFSPFR
jgi:LEA14-like dessication related protein